MRRLVIITGLILMLSLSFASAEIILSQTEKAYNLNDPFSLETTIVPMDSVNGFLEINMKCQEFSRNFYKEYIALDSGQKKKITTSVPLTKEFMTYLGLCSIEAVLSNEKAQSQSFLVSDKIIMSFSSDKISVEPNDEIVVSGGAVKENGKKPDGFINFYIDNSELNITETLSGNFSFKIKMPGNLRAGQYAIKAFAYEKTSEGLSNTGFSNVFITMISVPKELTIAMSVTTTNPGSNITYKPIIYDQAGDEAKEKDVVVKIKDPNKKLASERLIKSGNEDEFWFAGKAFPGVWEIIASSSGLTFSKTINVNSVERADFLVENDILTVTNTGNIIYTKPLTISIGEEKQVVEVGSIAVEGVKKFKLAAPDGNYNVIISDGEKEFSGNLLLTGNAVRIYDLSGKMNFKYYLLVWIFLFSVLGIFIYSTGSKIFPGKKKYDVNEGMADLSNDKKNAAGEKPRQKQGVIDVSKSDKSVKKLSELVSPATANPNFAEHALVLKGERQNSCLLTLNIKNIEKLDSFREILDQIKEKITENKGVLYQSNNFLLGIFAPIVTKTFRIDNDVIKLAGEINKMLAEHNRKFKDKMDFGLSVHSGELILEKTPERLRFTSSDNTLGLAKRVAELAKNEFLLSEASFKKAGNEIRAEKEVRENINVYHLQRMINRDDTSRFIHEFLQRNREVFAKKE